jgi:hypothetical protein
MEIMNENKESKLVFDPRVARRLCKRGFYIIDLKPLRGEPGKSVFVFANTKEFQEAHAEILDEFNKKEEVEEPLGYED